MDRKAPAGWKREHEMGNRTELDAPPSEVPSPRSGFVQQERWSEQPPRFSVAAVAGVRTVGLSSLIAVGRRSLSLDARACERRGRVEHTQRIGDHQMKTKVRTAITTRNDNHHAGLCQRELRPRHPTSHHRNQHRHVADQCRREARSNTSAHPRFHRCCRDSPAPTTNFQGPGRQQLHLAP